MSTEDGMDEESYDSELKLSENDEFSSLELKSSHDELDGLLLSIL